MSEIAVFGLCACSIKTIRSKFDKTAMTDCYLRSCSGHDRLA